MIRLEVIKNALLGVSSNVYHYAAPPNQIPPYIVWGEDGAHDFVAGNKHMEQAYQGTVDLYTTQENDPLMTSIPNALNDTEAAWYLNSVQYEEDTKLIHHEWVFEV